MALCGSLYRLATDVTIDAIVTFAERLRREVGESLVGACVRRDPALQRSPAFIPLGSRQDTVREKAMHWRIAHYPAGDAFSRGYVRAGVAAARRHGGSWPLPSTGPPVDPQVAPKEESMDLNRDAMLVGLHITAWSGRLYDREASNHVAVHHDRQHERGAV